MQLVYGGYHHAQNEVSIDAITRDSLIQGGIIYARKEHWELSGRLQADTQAELTAAIQALEAAYSVHGRDLIFYLDDGVTETAHKMKTADTIGGVRVVSQPSYPISGAASAEYSTYRNYRISVEAEFPASNVDIIQWSEVLQFQGTGGPRHTHKTPLVGPPVKQLLVQQTPCRVTQSGSAVGLFGYPNPPGPLWSDAEQQEQRSISPGLPERVGQPGNATYLRWPISWSYSFEHSQPLIGFPTPWPA